MDALHGIWLVARTPRLWPLCFGPLLVALTVYVLLGVAGGLVIVPRLPGWLGITPGGREWWLAGGLATVAFVVLWLFLFSFVFRLLAGLFFGVVWDRLSLAVENLSGGNAPPDARLGCGTLAGDSLSRLLLSGFLGVLALLGGFVLGPIPGLLAAAVVGLLDYTSPAYLRRGMTLGPQWARLLRRTDRATVGFAFLAGLLSLLPLVGVLLTPGLIAGGTLLARRREAAAPLAP